MAVVTNTGITGLLCWHKEDGPCPSLHFTGVPSPRGDTLHNNASGTCQGSPRMLYKIRRSRHGIAAVHRLELVTLSCSRSSALA